MKISTKGRYALRLMLDLANCDPNENISLRDVASRQNISMKYMEQIVSQLTKAGLLRSVRGPLGGYRLSKSPDQYTVGNILQITEGSLAPVACLDVQPNQCSMHEQCITLPFWQGLHGRVLDYVNNTTLADLINQYRQANSLPEDASLLPYHQGSCQ